MEQMLMPDGHTPLYRASTRSYLPRAKVEHTLHEFVKLLIENGARIDVRSNFGDTELHQACRQGDEHIVQIIIDKSADVKSVDRSGNTVLHFAAYGRHCIGLGNSYELSTDFYYRDGDRDAAMQPSLLKVYQVSAKIVVGGGPNIQPGNHRGDSAFKLASSFGYEEITRLLDDNDADFESMSIRLPRWPRDLE
ncbi:hypothetical protein CSAL01_10886 [Colletotrichum salicis]|uniref:Uncharacterized protein n=1 Tax=Colletotrichum salicis TaxID=1209931 RepID=A0A135UK80_9PEZI|nr:hypothetical protein CSAL01_10886 [Colletotrichum salicis]